MRTGRKKEVKKGILFDMDGTLWDSAKTVARAWTDILHRVDGIDRVVTEEQIRGVMGLTMDTIADILFPDLPRRRELLQRCCALENEYIARDGGELYPDLEKTWTALREKGYHLYIVSNCQAGYIEAFLEKYGFWKYFEDTECFGNNGLSKGENIALVVRRNALDSAAYVGDIQADYEAAKQAGVSFYHAAYGFGTISEIVPELSCIADLARLA